MSSTTYLYWIHYSDHTDPHTEGYIGVSKYPEKRFKAHSHPEYNNNQHLYRAIHGKGCEMTILEEFSTPEEAYAKEEEYRPHDHIGFNIIPGGGVKGRPPVQWGKKYNLGNHKPRHSNEWKNHMSNHISKLKWITNGEENKRVPATDTLPEGWRYGKRDRRSASSHG